MDCYDKNCEIREKNSCPLSICMYSDRPYRMGHIHEHNVCVVCGEDMKSRQGILPCRGHVE